jgi:dihydropteroate synthase
MSTAPVVSGVASEGRTWRIQCRDRELLARHGAPLIAGILNVTPDSFYDGGRYMTLDRARLHADFLVDGGASIIDVGGASSRPKGAAYGAGAGLVSAEVERSRVLPVVAMLARDVPEAVISVDTFRAEVAEACLDAGAHMINDITALRFDPRLARVVARHNAAIVLMHSVGLPGEMPHVSTYDDVLVTIRTELSEAVARAVETGIPGIVTDPGFGFGKSTADNYRIVGGLEHQRVGDYPIMVGVSRKNSIGVVLGEEGYPAPVHERLFGSLGVTAVAALRGAAIIRTHDVAATSELLRTLSFTLSSARTAAQPAKQSATPPDLPEPDRD